MNKNEQICTNMYKYIQLYDIYNITNMAFTKIQPSALNGDLLTISFISKFAFRSLKILLEPSRFIPAATAVTTTPASLLAILALVNARKFSPLLSTPIQITD